MENDFEAIRRDHGTGMGVRVNPVQASNAPIVDISDSEAIRRDHGAGMGVRINPVQASNAPIVDISDSEAIRRDHGAGIGVHSDGRELYGTDDATLKNIVNMLTHSDKVENVGDLVAQLPESAIIKVLETRYRHAAFVLQDRAGINTETAVKLGSDISLDLKIMMEAVNKGKNLYDETINATNYIGDENYQNVIGLLEVYQNDIREAGKPIPIFDSETGKRFDALDYIELNKEEIAIVAKEFGYSVGGKSM